MDFPQIILTNSAEETEYFGAKIAEAVADNPSLPRFIALYGDLGTGKTAFTRGFVRYFSYSARVKSPTFAIVHEYNANHAQIKKIRHFDMYRIEGEDDLFSTGFFDFSGETDALLIAEWCEKIPFALPEDYIKINIEKTGADFPDSRKITAEIIQECHENTCR